MWSDFDSLDGPHDSRQIAELRCALLSLMYGVFDSGCPSVVELLRKYQYSFEAETLERAIAKARGVLDAGNPHQPA